MANFHVRILKLINSSPTEPPSSKMTVQSSQALPQIEYVYIGHIILKQLSKTGQGVIVIVQRRKPVKQFLYIYIYIYIYIYTYTHYIL